ncbi:hypothetical protein C7N43_19505 [Sphingobacteriales bacterium UPWRP_1]|nr:hypothetical protein B6N25_02000 [Sphingobacteriales bacterium TSM_CSS]PSJ75329.1 hypothetical protein C7N43_19505 [Sphingobacteriales bacterium UPWRP_1]
MKQETDLWLTFLGAQMYKQKYSILVCLLINLYYLPALAALQPDLLRVRTGQNAKTGVVLTRTCNNTQKSINLLPQFE